MENIKFGSESHLHAILEQMEYYFSEINLIKDDFLREHTDQEGWVKLELIVTFNKMKQLHATPELIILASTYSNNNVIETDRVRNRVRRSLTQPIQRNVEEFKRALKQRCLVVCYFSKEKSTETLRQMFEAYGVKVEYVERAINRYEITDLQEVRVEVSSADLMIFQTEVARDCIISVLDEIELNHNIEICTEYVINYRHILTQAILGWHDIAKKIHVSLISDCVDYFYDKRVNRLFDSQLEPVDACRVLHVLGLGPDPLSGKRYSPKVIRSKMAGLCGRGGFRERVGNILVTVDEGESMFRCPFSRYCTLRGSDYTAGYPMDHEGQRIMPRVGGERVRRGGGMRGEGEMWGEGKKQGAFVQYSRFLEPLSRPLRQWKPRQNRYVQQEDDYTVYEEEADEMGYVMRAQELDQLPAPARTSSSLVVTGPRHGGRGGYRKTGPYRRNNIIPRFERQNREAVEAVEGQEWGGASKELKPSEMRVVVCSVSEREALKMGQRNKCVQAELDQNSCEVRTMMNVMSSRSTAGLTAAHYSNTGGFRALHNQSSNTAGHRAAPSSKSRKESLITVAPLGKIDEEQAAVESEECNMSPDSLTAKQDKTNTMIQCSDVNNNSEPSANTTTSETTSAMSASMSTFIASAGSTMRASETMPASAGSTMGASETMSTHGASETMSTLGASAGSTLGASASSILGASAGSTLGASAGSTLGASAVSSLGASAGSTLDASVGSRAVVKYSVAELIGLSRSSVKVVGGGCLKTSVPGFNGKILCMAEVLEEVRAGVKPQRRMGGGEGDMPRADQRYKKYQQHKPLDIHGVKSAGDADVGRRSVHFDPDVSDGSGILGRYSSQPGYWKKGLRRGGGGMSETGYSGGSMPYFRPAGVRCESAYASDFISPYAQPHSSVEDEYCDVIGYESYPHQQLIEGRGGEEGGQYQDLYPLNNPPHGSYAY